MIQHGHFKAVMLIVAINVIENTVLAVDRYFLKLIQIYTAGGNVRSKATC